MRFIQTILATFVLIGVITSCSPIKQIKRHKKAIDRIIKKHPHLTVSDTLVVVVRDTVTTDSIRVDTTFSIDADTIIIEKDRLIIRYIRTGDQVSITGEVKADTIYLTKIVEVPYEKVVIKKTLLETLLGWIPWWIWLLILAVLAYVGKTFIKGAVKKVLRLP